MTTIYAAMRDALLVVTGEPGDWRTTRRLDGHSLECVAAHPSHPDRVFVGTFDDGLLRSKDGGESFEHVATGLVGKKVMSAAVNPHDADEVWVGTEPSAVYATVDGGDSWTQKDGLTDLPSASDWSFPPRPQTHHVRWIEIDPDVTDHRYVGIEAGALVQTHDRGGSWEDRVSSSRLDNHSLTTHVDAPGRAWAAAGDGYAETHDGGETWEHPQEGLDHRYCWSVVVDPDDPDTVLLSSATSPRVAHNADRAESYLYRKRGDGAWEHAEDGLPAGEGMLRAVLAAGDSGGECYALTNLGLFRTTDMGDSWDRVEVDWPAAFERQTARGLVVL